MVVEADADSIDVWKVGGNVAAGYLDLAVLHVFRVDKEYVVDFVDMLQQNCAYQSVKVTSSDQSAFGSGLSAHALHSPLFVRAALLQRLYPLRRPPSLILETLPASAFRA